MQKIYYNEKDRWEKFWKSIVRDPDKTNPKSYPIFPAIDYIGYNKGKILECGCGLGRVINYFHTNGFDIIGLDYNFYALQQLKSNYRDRRLLQANAMALPFKDKSFNYMFLLGVVDTFEQHKDRKKALKEAKRVLTEGGRLFLSSPNAKSIFWLFYRLKRNSFVRRLFGKRALPQYFGQYAFKKEELYDEIESEDFSIEKVCYVHDRFALHYIFPFFRQKITDNQTSLMKLERAGGEDVYKLNIIGNIFDKITRRFFSEFIGPCIYFVAKK